MKYLSSFFNLILNLSLILYLTLPAFAQQPPQRSMSQHKYTPKELGYWLVWQDEFNGNQLDTTKWKIRHRKRDYQKNQYTMSFEVSFTPSNFKK